MLRTLPIDPMLPIEAMLPTDPIEAIEPTEAIEAMLATDAIEAIESSLWISSFMRRPESTGALDIRPRRLIATRDLPMVVGCALDRSSSSSLSA